MAETLAEKFEDIVARIFAFHNFVVRRQISDRRDNYTNTPADRADLIISSQSGPIILVEVKYYRSKQVSIDMISHALNKLERMRRSMETSSPYRIGYLGMLVMSAESNKPMLDFIASNYQNIILCDYSAIRAFATRSEELLNEFDDLIRTSSLNTEPRNEKEVDLGEIINPRQAAPVETPLVEKPLLGAALCKEIRNIKSGDEFATVFEEKMTESLRYIFDKDLVSWAKQKSTSDGLSRYDLIARVSSRHDFWQLIANSFRSHYIVFEFKNYKEKIKQPQIYTTEKYLYTTALRSTAIIVSRSGADKNALAACRGALRETGKLIINLNIEQICEMLTLKDEGNDHNAVLVDLVDHMLMTLTR